MIRDGRVEVVPHCIGNHYHLKARIEQKESDCYRIQPLCDYILPDRGSFLVELVQKRKRYLAELELNMPEVRNRLFVLEDQLNYADNWQIVF